MGPPSGAFRLGVLWLVLFGVYAAGIGLEPRAPDDPYLRTAQALIEDGAVLRGAQGLGFPLFIAPAELVGAVELFLAAFAALGFVFAALLARRIVPEPYASTGAALAGLSAPAIVHAGEILPFAAAGTLLAGAALCAVAAHEDARVRPTLAGGAMLAVLPWLDPLLLVPAVPVGFALYEACRRSRRPTLGLISVELAAASIVIYATTNEGLYGGPTPWSALPEGVSATGAHGVAEHLERVPRLVTLFVGGDGLLRWAPVFALGFLAGWLLWRSRRGQIARVVAERAGAEATAGLLLTVVGAILLVAAFLTPALEPYARWLVPALPLAGALVAWGVRHAPRPVSVALGAASLALSASLFV
jgi:hypothetical protein